MRPHRNEKQEQEVLSVQPEMPIPLPSSPGPAPVLGRPFTPALGKRADDNVSVVIENSYQKAMRDLIQEKQKRADSEAAAAVKLVLAGIVDRVVESETKESECSVAHQQQLSPIQLLRAAAQAAIERARVVREQAERTFAETGRQLEESRGAQSINSGTATVELIEEPSPDSREFVRAPTMGVGLFATVETQQPSDEEEELHAGDGTKYFKAH